MPLYFKLWFFCCILLQCLADFVSGSVSPSKSYSCMEATIKTKGNAAYVPSQYNSRQCNKKDILLDIYRVKTVSTSPIQTVTAIKPVTPTKSTKTTVEKMAVSSATPMTGKRLSITMVTASKTVTTTVTKVSSKVHQATSNIKSVCSQAEPIPTVQYPCTRLDESHGKYCKQNGVKLDSYVFKNTADQSSASEKLNRFQWGLKKLLTFLNLKISVICLNVLRTVYCRYYFPACDKTGRQMREQMLCKETCDYFKKSCKKAVEAAKDLNDLGRSMGWPLVWEIINCAKFPMRDAGISPECWYYEGENVSMGIDSSDELKNDCIYQDGRGYQGNVFVTSSGIPCQPWTAQCPHRHTMVSTYPELKNASGYCRNPRGSGQRPWCFTSDNDKRWEYCDIPRC